MARWRALPRGFSRSVVVIALAATMPLTGRAEPPDGPGPERGSPGGSFPQAEIRISWPDLVRLTDQHPQVVAGQHRVEAARAAVAAAGAVPNPSLEASTAYGQARDGAASRLEWGLGLVIPLDWVAQRGAKLEVADAEVKAAAAESLVSRREVLLHLGRLFWKLVFEQERVASLGDLCQQTEALASTVRRRVEQGGVRPVEAIRVEVEGEKIAGELESARSALRARRAQLGAWLGVSPGRQLVAVADLTKLPSPMTEDRAREEVRTGHPSLAAARAQAQVLAAHVTVERRARLPGVSLSAFTVHELDRRSYGVGLAIDLPLWNWNTGNIRRSESLLAAGRMQLESERIALEAAAIEVQATCQAGVTLATRYQERVLPRASEAARTIERTYQLGEAALLEVIDARRTLLETRRQFLDALVQAQTACSRLRTLAGEESP